MIHRFYAVTMTSIYRVSDRRSKGDPSPVAIKIAIRGPSAVPVGRELENGSMVAITKQLQVYIPEGGGMTSFERKIERVNTKWWGGQSSYIVALFTTKAKAMDCFAHPDHEPCDPRWIDETKKVVNRIGEEHPSFEVCRWEPLALLPS